MVTETGESTLTATSLQAWASGPSGKSDDCTTETVAATSRAVSALPSDQRRPAGRVKA